VEAFTFVGDDPTDLIFQVPETRNLKSGTQNPEP
jgi:hypothetical protein